MYLNNRKNQYDHRDCLEIGDKAEELLCKIFESKGYKAIKANKNQDINEHWDYEFSKDGISFKVDVKAMKRLSRNDSQKQDSLLWIELHSVRPNNRGWLYDGKADYLAFELTREFIIVSREKLIQLVESLTKNAKRVSSPKDALYNFYQRPGRNDLLTMIKTSDLDMIEHRVWQKI